MKRTRGVTMWRLVAPTAIWLVTLIFNRNETAQRRAFREQFGYSPSELVTSPHRGLPNAPVESARFSMERWLHSLRA
jgi:hypothetical protein